MFQVGHSSAIYNGKLYVVGGYNSRRGSYPVMENVECFDLHSNQWLIKRNLPQPRCHASLVVAMGSLYLIGGRTKTPGYAVSSMASILRYDEMSDNWQHVANMHVAATRRRMRRYWRQYLRGWRDPLAQPDLPGRRRVLRLRLGTVAPSGAQSSLHSSRAILLRRPTLNNERTQSFG